MGVRVPAAKISWPLPPGGEPRVGAGPGVVAQAGAVARAGGKDLVAAAVWVIAVDGGAPRIFARGYVRSRTDADAEALAIAGKEQAARPVSAAEALERDNLLARTGGHRLGVVLVALDGFGLADVQVTVLDSQAVGTVQPLDQGFAFLALQDVHRAGGTSGGIGEQDFVARAEQHEARNLEAFLVDLRLETLRNAQFGAFGLRDHPRPVVGRGRGKRRGQSFLLRVENGAGCQEQSATQDDSSEVHAQYDAARYGEGSPKSA